MATTKQVLDSVTTALTNIAAINALLTSQQALLTALGVLPNQNDEIIEELRSINERLLLMVGQL